jgi:outer membrane protein assembly factor BamB
VLFLNPDFYCIADGRNGNLLVGPIKIQELVKWWAAYASPAILKRDSEPPIVYLGGAYSSRASIALDGTRGLWLEYLPTERWALRFFNQGFGEGLLPPSKRRGWRGAQVEADGTLVCFDAATGKHLWKMQLPTAPSGIVSGDVDGDGETEFIFGGQDGNLLVVRDAGNRGEIVWRKTFDAPVGTPILADVNGDGKSEMVVSVGDGYVYVLGR